MIAIRGRTLIQTCLFYRTDLDRRRDDPHEASIHEEGVVHMAHHTASANLIEAFDLRVCPGGHNALFIEPPQNGIERPRNHAWLGSLVAHRQPQSQPLLENLPGQSLRRFVKEGGVREVQVRLPIDAIHPHQRAQ